MTLLLAVAIAASLWIGTRYVHQLASLRTSIETERLLAEILSTVQDAETGQRGYLLTSRTTYLQPYERARDKLPVALDGARTGLAGNAVEIAMLDRLRTAIDAKLRELDDTIALKRSGQAQAALAIVDTDTGQRLMDDVRTDLAQIEAELDRRQQKLETDVDRQASLLIPLAAIAMFSIPVLVWYALATLRASLARTAERLDAEHAENTRLVREVDARQTELGGLQDQFGLVLDSATDYGIILIDLGGIVTRWSNGAEALFGWPHTDAVGKPIDFIFTPEDRTDDRPAIEMRVARQDGGSADERWHLRRDGTRFWASGKMQTISSGSGDLLGYLKIVRDRTTERMALEAEKSRGDFLAARVDAQSIAIQDANIRQEQQSERRAVAEGQVRQLQKLEGLGQLTAGISHDFNNMLAVIIGSLDLIGRRYRAGNPGLERLLGAAQEGAQRASALTKRLLAFSRQQPLSPQVIDLNLLVAGMSELLRRTLGEQIRIETVLAGGLWPVNADPNEIEQILLNLAVNARDAMPDGGRLTIETANAHLDDAYAAQHDDVTPGQYVAVAVSDTGTGMPPDILARAFDPFFSTKPVGQGTGLGLSQLYGFARQSAGHTKIYSEANHGTAVKLYLPRWLGADRPTAPKPVIEASDELPRGRRDEIILVAEDEERVSLIAVEALRELGYTVRHAANGDQALELLAQHPGITLLLTDIVMPGMTGRELADRVTEREPEAKILYTTGYTRSAIVHSGTVDPGVALLPKPFTIEQLARKVRATIDGFGANR